MSHTASCLHLSPHFQLLSFSVLPNRYVAVAKRSRFLQKRRIHGKKEGKRVPVAMVGGFFGFGRRKPSLPEVTQAGDPVLHEKAEEVPLEDVGSESIQNIIDEMIAVMRNAPAVGLAAPQIGIPLQIIVLEDTKEYISYAPKEECRAQDRHPFDLLCEWISSTG
eukprot:TRINITY_DN19685_c0_g1_i4.p1 TRINITY_DN19685_c0_g1~~TRINITY_DN19685_c0_g1_i4.p1  ORF type:complete len:164 (+),score=29.64 TRINITY_DN19685_c0_g1_i4:130-621(+)